MAGPNNYSEQTIALVVQLRSEGRTYQQIADKMNASAGPKLTHPLNAERARGIFRRHGSPRNNAVAEDTTVWQEEKTDESWVIVCRDANLTTPEEIIAHAKIDMDVWQIDKIKIGRSTVTFKGLKETFADQDPSTDRKSYTKTTAVRAANPNITIVLKRKVPKQVEAAVKGLLERLAKKSPVVTLLKRPKLKQPQHSRELEICLMDIHRGLRCFTPGASGDWSPELCDKLVMETVERLVDRTGAYIPLQKVFLPIGNDWFHVDSIWHTTTAGTGQPEADSFLHSFRGGVSLAIAVVDRLKEIAPVEAYSIQGNHDRTASDMLGLILEAYYRNDKNVKIHASNSPYKFHRFGQTLIGYEHGHSVRKTALPGLLANECPDLWAATRYREWHLGDQHRKGSANPTFFEEQGVAIEFLPSLVAPNEWHKIKGFNWQQRGAMAFVYDEQEGPIARLQVNIDSHFNCLMGVENGKT